MSVTRWASRRRVAAAGASTVLLALSIAGTASASSLSVKIPYDGVVYSDFCTGEDVVLQGDLHAVIRFDDQTGATTFENINAQDLSATGTLTGDTYRIQQTELSIEQGSANGANGFTGTLTYHLIAPAELDNAVVHDTTHFTYDANGDPTAYHSGGFLECRG